MTETSGPSKVYRPPNRELYAAEYRMGPRGSLNKKRPAGRAPERQMKEFWDRDGVIAGPIAHSIQTCERFYDRIADAPFEPLSDERPAKLYGQLSGTHTELTHCLLCGFPEVRK